MLCIFLIWEQKTGCKHLRDFFGQKMSSMFIECTSRDNNSTNDPTNANTARTMEGILLAIILNLLFPIINVHYLTSDTFRSEFRSI